MIVIVVVHHDTKRLPNNAECDPKNDISQKRLFEAALQPVCDQDHGNLQAATSGLGNSYKAHNMLWHSVGMTLTIFCSFRQA